MHNEWWMQPAVQKSEAVLLPALERRSYSEYRFADRFAHARLPLDSFRPVTDAWPAEETTALSTYVRPRGSMAGRSVLRAAGVNTSPYAARIRPPRTKAGRRLLRSAGRRLG